MKTSDFNYHLPDELIAHYPLESRSDSRLLVYKNENEIEHKSFTDILDYFNSGDLLVLNNTSVIPARIFGKKDTGGEVEVLLERFMEDNKALVQIRSGNSPKIGTKIFLEEHETICIGRKDNFYILQFNDVPIEVFNTIGHIPLPPYINRDADSSDKKRYQTVYASQRGAVAAPTAGLHFTDGLIKKVKDKGTKVENVTLHIGLGTFRPVQVEDLNRHQMDSEYFEVSPDTAMAINQARKRHRKIIAVGTSTVRALETIAISGFQVTPKRGWTDKFIYPPYEYKMVDKMITNFHTPQSTLLMMVSAFAGRKLIKKAYLEAKRNKYRFLSYGDAMLII